MEASQALRAPEVPIAAKEGADVSLAGRGSERPAPGAAQMLSDFFDNRAETRQSALAVKAMGMNEGERQYADGRLTALAGTDASKLRAWDGASEAEEKKSRRGMLGTSLLPSRYIKSCVDGMGMNLMWGIFTKPINTYQLGPDCPEDPRFRVMVTKTTPPVLMLELHALATFNMMDADTSQDIFFGMDAAIQLLKMPKALKDKPLGYLVQGAGPHFCPGGNPAPKLYPGHTYTTTVQFVGYLPFVRCRELAMPGIVALHGSLVGGGVAYSLNNPVRFGDHKSSACFGNLSRGAVPGMVLSSNIPQALGLAGAVDIYLTDSTYSASACVKAGYMHGLYGGIQQTKQEALKQVRRLAERPDAQRIVGIKPPLDIERFGVEGWCIDMAARLEGIFRNVGGSASEKEQKAAAEKAKIDADAKENAAPKQEDWNEWRARQAKPKKRPKRKAKPRPVG
eukprot:TRINITY_DN58517_c0_g1_i1.p1 TRINITY_DN58517_c0_g1~~TRINITY_DN58517_c0_g1_i1.p1  ORF type:complete len:469 (-),score=89.97 TRINITY_DN58517_c0_g1_i1:116-1471(-)